VKKARRWLDTHHVPYRFHDFRKDGIDHATLSKWADKAGVELLVNRRSTTWRKISAEEQVSDGRHTLIDLMCRHPTLIKRPVISNGSSILIGFDQHDYIRMFL
jgi:arsenate reductase